MFNFGLLISVFCIPVSSCAELKPEKGSILAQFSKNTDNASIYFKRGQQLYDEEDYQGAIKYANQELEINPNSSEAYLLRGNARYELEEYLGAIEDFNLTLQINPNSFIAYRQRSDARTGLGDFKRANQDINRALEINSKYIDAYLSRALLRKMLGNHQLAIEDLDNIKKLDFGLAVTYKLFFEDSVNQALKENLKTQVINHTKSLQANPQNADAYYNRGYARAGLKDKQGAITDFKKAVELYQQLGKTVDSQDALNIIKGLQ